MSGKFKPEEYEEFYSIISKNIKSDFYTPNIKAEVIIDMLITEDIAEIMRPLNSNSKKRFIAKEMPLGYICKKNQMVPIISNTNKCKKVDYVLADDDYLYLVELKTTQESIDGGQFRTYCKILEDSNKKKQAQGKFLLDQLCKILGKKYKQKNIDDIYNEFVAYLYEEANVENNGIDIVEQIEEYQKRNKKIVSTKKYIHTIARIIKSWREEDWRKNRLKLVYITPKKIEDSQYEFVQDFIDTEQFYNISFKDICEMKNINPCLCSILKELFD